MKTVGKMTAASGFANILFQSSLSASKSSDMPSKHYSKAIHIQEQMVETEKYWQDPKS
jgi:hypothetical protein